MDNFQVTIGASATPLIAVGQKNVYASWATIQANGTNPVRVGRVPVAGAYGTGVGILLTGGGGALTATFDMPRGSCLNQWKVAGTEGDVVDVIYEQSS